MMIHLQVALIGVSPLKKRVKIKAPDGSTVGDILNIYKQKYKVDDIFSSMAGISVLINGNRGTMNGELEDKDEVKVFRPMVRG